jgi:hypothetical protein
MVSSLWKHPPWKTWIHCWEKYRARKVDRLIFKILNNGLSDSKNIEKAKIAFENVLKGRNSKDLYRTCPEI